YLVAGGLGGFGLRTACWLAERGAGHIVLLGRRGPDSPDAAAAVAAVRTAGAEARVMACDIADANRLQAVLGEIQGTLPPLKGIVHAAMVLDDGLIRNLDHERFLRVLGPKVAGAWNLHRLTRHLPLDLFVLYSSATTLIGNPGQANYVAANAYLEALAAYRRGLGLPATAVCWGAIADVGYLAQNQAVRASLEAHLGAAALDSGQALTRLGELLADQRNGIAVFDFDWHALSRFLPATRAARFDAVRRQAGSTGAAAENEDIRALIGQLDEASARALVERLVSAEIADILRLPPERVPVDRSLYDIGMDSLMGVELVLGIEKRFGINLPTMALSEGPTVQRIAARLLQELHGPADAEPSADARLKDMMADMARQHALEVDESELDTVLTDLRTYQATGGAP
ncbi:MAG: SDR family NAD(P)-dependent oxidoreductase, partial [Thiobacillus sp.]|nr:SDR family NAD(P)-dependent oxidoreductase [Thiobacillus sp.]